MVAGRFIELLAGFAGQLVVRAEDAPAIGSARILAARRQVKRRRAASMAGGCSISTL
jgi:hypothetical protein